MRALKESGVHNGVAAYWDTKLIQALGNGNLQLAQHGSDLGEYRWITSKKYYRKTYDYAVISEDQMEVYKIPKQRIIEINGEPRKSVSCGNKTVLIYGPDKLALKQNKFATPGSSYTWKACELPTRIGRYTGECESDKADLASEGHLTFGPYENLHSGRYSFEIHYASEERSSVDSGEWDVAVALSDEVKTLEKGRLLGSEGLAKKVTGSFVVGANDDMGGLEIRTLAHQGRALKIARIKVTRLE